MKWHKLKKQYYQHSRKFHEVPEKMDSRERLWIAFGDVSAGHLKLLYKRFYFCHDWRTFAEDIQTINSLELKNLVLPYNGFGSYYAITLIKFLQEVWRQKTNLKFDLELFILPTSFKTRMFSDNQLIGKKSEQLKNQGNYRRIVVDKSSNTELRDWQSYIDYQPLKMPFLDLESEKFDLPVLYDYCCKYLAYTLKHEIIFPLHSTGINYYNTACLSAKNKEKDTIHDFFLFTKHWVANCEMLNLWKLLHNLSIEDLDGEKTSLEPISLLSRNGTFENFGMLDFWHELGAVRGTAKKNEFANALAGECKQYIQKPERNDYLFLFPMVLFLGHYKKYGVIESCIPEYNFHELIATLINIIKGNPIPELLPDIIGEKIIDLNAYRHGYIKLQPICYKHYFEDDMLIAEFKTKDIALNFLANLYDSTEAEFMIVDESGKIAFRNIINLQYLIDRLEEAEKTYPEYKINMWILDGNTPRKMSLQEILEDSAAKIVNYFDHDSFKAVEYLRTLSEQFKNDFRRFSAVE